MQKTIGEGGLGIRIIQIPIEVQDNPLSAVYFVNHLKVSTTTNQEIEVTNSTNQPMSVAIYPGSATNFNGKFSAAQGATQNELTSWISITPKVQVIPAKSSIQAAVRIEVPENAEPGELFGVIWASTSSGSNEVGLVNVNRVGIRMYIQVDNDSNVVTTSIEKARNTVSFGNEAIFSILAVVVSVAFLFVMIKKIRDKKAKKNVALSDNPDFVGFLSN